MYNLQNVYCQEHFYVRRNITSNATATSSTFICVRNGAELF